MLQQIQYFKRIIFLLFVEEQRNPYNEKTIMHTNCIAFICLHRRSTNNKAVYSQVL